MKEMYAYSKVEKENIQNKNYNDDAPDSIISTWIVANDMFNYDGRFI